MNERNEELLQAYLDGELDPEARVDLERRMASDPALKDGLDRLSFARNAVMGLPRAEVPPNLADKVLRRARETAASPSAAPSSTVSRPMAWRAAAAIALLLLPVGGFAAGYRTGVTRGSAIALAPEATPTAARAAAPTTLSAAAGPSDFLVLLHGNAGAGELAEEQRSWRDLQYANWADSLRGTGRLVRADDLSEDNGQGVWADGTEDPGEVWFASSGAVPSRSYVVRAWDYDQALDIARTSPHLAFGGSVTVRRIAESP